MISTRWKEKGISFFVRIQNTRQYREGFTRRSVLGVKCLFPVDQDMEKCYYILAARADLIL